MGAKSTKLFKTPELIQKIFYKESRTVEKKDPRSPDVVRTPLNELNINKDEVDAEDECCFRDPRSPTSHITRTPIVFDSDQSKSFVFEEDDTFNDLFNSNPDPKHKIKLEKINKVDPRSPSSDIDRTPLVFDDSIILELPPITLSDDEETEDEIIKSVLAMFEENEDETKPPVVNKQIEKIKNMHLNKKCNKKSKNNKPKVYQDSNVFYSTPKKGNLIEKDVTQNKRTPLGCVENKLRVRSRSVENIKYKNIKSNGGIYDENNCKIIKRVSVFEIESENNSFLI